jgi:hypothetical protein
MFNINALQGICQFQSDTSHNRRPLVFNDFPAGYQIPEIALVAPVLKLYNTSTDLHKAQLHPCSAQWGGHGL